MNIIYFISVHTHGKGGHYHSLDHISRQIATEHSVKIISIGPHESEIIKNNPHFSGHIYFEGFNLIHLKNEIKRVTQKFNPQIYHCFDIGSFNLVKVFGSSNIVLAVTKCGGRNPKYYPRIKNIILFSKENLLWFKSKKRYENSKIFLIPNRVKSISMNNFDKSIEKNEENFTFMRICRIGNNYKKSIFNSIHLIHKLYYEYSIENVQLYIIGTIEDKEVYNKIINHPLTKLGKLIILTDNKYTVQASNMLYLADAVIGTGRGIMEATSVALPILAINKNSKIPVLINSNNFENAFETNFSERNNFINYNDKDNFNNIIKMMNDTQVYKSYCELSKKIFKGYFDVSEINEKYEYAYNNFEDTKYKFIYDIPYTLKTIYNFWISSIKR